MDNEETRKILCSNIKSLREHAGLSKRQMAKIVGINYAHYCKIESNQAEPRITTVIYIALALGVGFKELIKHDQ